MQQKKNINIAFILKGLNAYDAHIKPFIDNAPNENYRFFIFHINKYYSPEVHLDPPNVTCVNLTKEFNYKLAISKREIDVIISLNPGNIFDLFFLSICKLQGVITIYYQHGIQLDFSLFDPKTLSQNKSIYRKLLSLKKYIFFYTNFTLNICLNPRSQMLFDAIKTKTRHLFIEKDKTKIPKYGLKNNHCDFAFVYGESDKNYLIKSMNMCSDNIFISGYPFVPFDKFKNKTALENKRKTVLYLSTALRTAGVIPMSIEEEKDFYRQVNYEVKNAGGKLMLKLHPLEDEKLFKSYFNKNDVEIIRSGNLSDLTYEADLILGEYTTAFFYPIRLYKPIIIIKSKYFKEFPFDFTKFGIGTKTEIENLSQTIKKTHNLSKKHIADYDAFNKKYINYNNNESSFSFVYKYINKIIKKY